METDQELCPQGCPASSPCQLTKVAVSRAEDKLCSLRSAQPLPFFWKQGPYCGGFYKNSQPSTGLSWTTHCSSDDTAF